MNWWIAGDGVGCCSCCSCYSTAVWCWPCCRPCCHREDCIQITRWNIVNFRCVNQFGNWILTPRWRQDSTSGIRSCWGSQSSFAAGRRTNLVFRSIYFLTAPTCHTNKTRLDWNPGMEIRHNLTCFPSLRISMARIKSSSSRKALNVNLGKSQCWVPSRAILPLVLHFCVPWRMVISNTSPGQRRAKPCKPAIWFNPPRNQIRSSTSQQGKIECQNITVHGNGCERTFHLDVQRSEQVFQLTFQCAHGLVAFFKTRSGTPRKDTQLCGNPHKEKKKVQ